MKKHAAQLAEFDADSCVEHKQEIRSRARKLARLMKLMELGKCKHIKNSQKKKKRSVGLRVCMFKQRAHVHTSAHPMARMRTSAHLSYTHICKNLLLLVCSVPGRQWAWDVHQAVCAT
eukprot:6212996-Pleurochrysis_carterae.AAC.2